MIALTGIHKRAAVLPLNAIQLGDPSTESGG